MRNFTLMQRGHTSLQVSASTPRPNPARPDPFDRHASPRDKQNNSFRQASASGKGSGNAGRSMRKGRPAHLRSPDDSPLRDGNRDRLVGLLTERAAKTLLVYLQETNPTVYHWMFCYIKEHPIPLQGSWDEMSGDAFLRNMLNLAPETASMNSDTTRSKMYDNMARIDVDPRQLAQRIMDIRVQLSKEFVQDLKLISDENSVLLRETLQSSLENALTADPPGRVLPPRDVSKVFVHPELLTHGGDLHPEVAQSHPELLPVVLQQAEIRRSQSPAPVAADGGNKAAGQSPRSSQQEGPPSAGPSSN